MIQSCKQKESPNAKPITYKTSGITVTMPADYESFQKSLAVKVTNDNPEKISVITYYENDEGRKNFEIVSIDPGFEKRISVRLRGTSWMVLDAEALISCDDKTVAVKIFQENWFY